MNNVLSYIPILPAPPAKLGSGSLPGKSKETSIIKKILMEKRYKYSNKTLMIILLRETDINLVQEH